MKGILGGLQTPQINSFLAYWVTKLELKNTGARIPLIFFR